MFHLHEIPSVHVEDCIEEHLKWEFLACSIGRRESEVGDVAVCSDTGKDGLLDDSTNLRSTACVVCWGIDGCWLC
jgi:hypothetical protein